MGDTLPVGLLPVMSASLRSSLAATGLLVTIYAPRERITSVDDHVLFKVKVQRWRGAVWMADDGIPWLVAAGQRDNGSPDDFYASLTARGKAARSQYNAAHTPR